MDNLAGLTFADPALQNEPLAGVTVLAVEDSRFASEALRLMCRHSGARLRRADCLHAAYRHLSVYRPNLVLVDLGLPDGSGLDLIRDLSRASPQRPALLATSGDAALAEAALFAGADSFLPKPFNSVAAFQQAVLDSLPGAPGASGLHVLSSEAVQPDPLALRDDLALVERILSAPGAARAIDYLAQFLTSLGQSANDLPLRSAASVLLHERALGQDTARQLTRIAEMVRERLGEAQTI